MLVCGGDGIEYRLGAIVDLSSVLSPWPMTCRLVSSFDTCTSSFCFGFFFDRCIARFIPCNMGPGESFLLHRLLVMSSDVVKRLRFKCACHTTHVMIVFLLSSLTAMHQLLGSWIDGECCFRSTKLPCCTRCFPETVTLGARRSVHPMKGFVSSQNGRIGCRRR